MNSSTDKSAFSELGSKALENNDLAQLFVRIQELAEENQALRSRLDDILSSFEISPNEREMKFLKQIKDFSLREFELTKVSYQILLWAVVNESTLGN